MKEEDIRPQAIFDEYLRLAKIDIDSFFKDCEMISIDCPACGQEGEFSFVKHDFSYDLCSDCKTLYVNPRPIREAFDKYYSDSPSTKYWADVFYKSTADARKEKLWKPKAAMILEMLNQPRQINFVDIGGGYGVFAELMREEYGFETHIIEPNLHLSEICKKKGFKVSQSTIEALPKAEISDVANCFVCFELFEHLYNVKEFLQKIYELMNSKDHFIFTTLSSTGADILALWQDSKSVSPPHHLNFLNPKSVSKLLSSLGFKEIQVTTPGKLDVDIMVNSSKDLKDRFFATQLDIMDGNERSKLQKYLSENGLSSHMMISCKKG
ncbi:MAG: class I SAM-dependent methyltransferase [Candidatus Cloacimonetes bacterium]|nr:class I SAM-dependent methyltransferase [Candidatus Cloacimonadota bacterium]